MSDVRGLTRPRALGVMKNRRRLVESFRDVYVRDYSPTIGHFVSHINTTNSEKIWSKTNAICLDCGLFILGIPATRQHVMVHSICSMARLFTTNAFVAKYYAAAGHVTSHFTFTGNTTVLV